MKIFPKVLLAAIAVASIAACATNPDKITPNYVPESKYAGMSCVELDSLYARNHNDMQKLSREMKTANKKTKAGAWVGMLVFWPALFFMEGKDVSADEALAIYKGNEVALLAAMDKCDALSIGHE